VRFADADAIVEAVAPELRSGDVVAIFPMAVSANLRKAADGWRIARRAARMIVRTVAFIRTLLALLFWNRVYPSGQLLSPFPGR